MPSVRYRPEAVLGKPCVIAFWHPKMIKFLKIDTSGNVPCPEAHNPTLSALHGLKTAGGTSLTGKFPDISLVLKDGSESPPGLVDYFKVGLLSVVSSKLKDVLHAMDAEVEYFPVTVFYRDVPLNDYFVANPLKSIRAVDLAASDIELDDELPSAPALSVRHLVLDESKFRGTRLAVISEVHEIGMSADVCAAIVAAGCVGCTFVEPVTVRY